MSDNNREMPKIDAELYFVIDEKNNQIELTDKGVDFLSGEDASDFFIMPEIGTEIAQIEEKNLPEEEEIALKDELFRDFSIKRSEEHSLNSSHVRISYAVFCLKKKTKKH